MNLATWPADPLAGWPPCAGNGSCSGFYGYPAGGSAGHVANFI